MERIRERSGGPGAIPEPSRPLLLLGQSHPYADPWPTAIRSNQLKARDTGLSVAAVARAARAAATVARARSPAVTLDGKPGCKTAGRGCASRVRSTLHNPAAHSEKIRNPRLRAGPRATRFRPHTPCPASRDRRPRPEPRAGAPRNDTGTAGSDRGVSPGRGSCADTVGRPVFAATAAPPRGTRDYSTGPGDESVGTTSHTP